MEDNGNMQTFKQLVILVDITIERERGRYYIFTSELRRCKKNSDLRFMIKITVFWIEPKKTTQMPENHVLRGCKRYCI